ncbi:sulfatase-like hydrolase/transferase [Verrucomicrobium sp. BvORR106]|uniref:sulfatase-like hydrolase/transferase n=1 Tax=Verrucomicrobium sp. BvORR106 TaxID=1403819 RepID=UPI00056E5199|nr:sulfatase-like hydrolase/transferase [Verrucomicrobium sp. BvORR106]
MFPRRPLLLLCLLLFIPRAASQAAAPPNILWLTSEDNGPQLGCYGDTYAKTPHLDALAARSLRYNKAWSNAPVCAPARTTIISGRFPTGDGSEHMRSLVPLPAEAQLYPQLLRASGYYCTNNSKEDYNLEKPDGTWDESSAKAHYNKRPAGQPFFAVFNTTISHESQIRTPGHQLVHDPAAAPIPPYHPDTPEVRHDWAQYYDKLTEMDQEVGRRLKELEDAGLAESTIVFYYGDHGAGMPRSKRWPYNSGLQVPLIVYFPPQYAHLAPQGYQQGGATDRLVSFVDLAPTLLSLIGKEAPSFLQGRAFAGTHTQPAPEFLHGFRGRMDERYDLVRSVTDGRFVYLRHYMPHLPYGQHLGYMFQMPTARVWRDLAIAGKLNEDQRHFWEPKPVEELYDLQSDRWEVNNLASEPNQQARLDTLRKAVEDQARKIRDLGFIPEAERLRISGNQQSPRDAFKTDAAYPFEAVFTLASQASRYTNPDPAPFLTALGHEHPLMRYWGVLGLQMRGVTGVQAGHDQLLALLRDVSPSVRIAAASALGQYGSPADLPACLDLLVKEADPTQSSQPAAMEALNGLDALDDKALPVKDRIAALPKRDPKTPKRLQEYVVRLHEKIAADLGTPPPSGDEKEIEK